MNNRTNKLIFGFALLIFTSGCQQLCQQPNAQPIQTLSETQWRLVETTDQAILNGPNGFDRFNFPILNFRRNFSGDFQIVTFNDLVETPQATFRWNPVTEDTILMALQQTGAATEQQLRFTYDLGTDLEMIADDGSYYRYVPFTGVVDPDSNCTF